MANQLNYPQPLNSTFFQRPERFTKVDHDLLQEGSKSVVFGTDQRDVVELWIYNPDSSFADHIVLPFNDPALTLSTVLDVNGTAEMLNLDFKNILSRMNVFPGRYSITANFFRNEVGSEADYKLFISDISTDRTQITVEPVTLNVQAVQDIFEFVVPSVPRQIAKGLIDQAFGKEQTGDPASQLDPDKVASEMTTVASDTIQRINYSHTTDVYRTMVTTIMDRAYILALEYMAEDAQNNEIQYVELEAYVEKALVQVIYSMKQNNEIDPRFELR